jgi:hypothetical protein
MDPNSKIADPPINISMMGFCISVDIRARIPCIKNELELNVGDTIADVFVHGEMIVRAALFSTVRDFVSIILSTLYR